MHQSIVRSPWPLAPRRCHRSHRRRRPLPLLRRLSSQRTSAAQPALPHAPSSPYCPTAPPPAPALTARLHRNLAAPSRELLRGPPHLISRRRPSHALAASLAPPEVHPVRHSFSFCL